MWNQLIWKILHLCFIFSQEEDYPYLADEDGEYGGVDKRAWNSGFAGGMGKRAWNSGFAGGMGKRAWNSGFTGGMGKRAWNSGFTGELSFVRSEQLLYNSSSHIVSYLHTYLESAVAIRHQVYNVTESLTGVSPSVFLEVIARQICSLLDSATQWNTILPPNQRWQHCLTQWIFIYVRELPEPNIYYEQYAIGLALCQCEKFTTLFKIPDGLVNHAREMSLTAILLFVSWASLLRSPTILSVSSNKVVSSANRIRSFCNSSSQSWLWGAHI